MKRIKTLASLGLIIGMVACSTVPNLDSADLWVGPGDAGPGLWLVPINHTERYAPSIGVEDVWAGNVVPRSKSRGGGKSTCCLSGRRDWSKPVEVRWRWGAERDPVTRAIVVEGEDRSALVSFPRAPRRLNKSIKEDWSYDEYMADESFLCIIFRTTDEVEFAFSPTGFGCVHK
jgi:hypothetical protein